MDYFTREVIRDALVDIGDMMFNAMVRTSMSPIVYEAKDFAVGATNAGGELLAQGNGLAAFLATLDSAVTGTIEHWKGRGAINPGDVFISNSPYEGGGTHLSDVSIILPVFFEGELVAWTVNKAHWIDIGGTNAGSVATNATSIYQEGLHLRFLKVLDRGQPNDAIFQFIRDNVRLPENAIGDMQAGIAAARVGERRLLELFTKYGTSDVLETMDALLEYGRVMTQKALAALPHGTYEAEDVLEDDGLGTGPLVLRVKVTVTAEKVIADFTGTSAQMPGPVNCSYACLVTAARCILKSITNPDVMANGGSFQPLEVIAPEGSAVNATAPAPVSVYYETLVAAMDVMWKALAPVLADRLPAGHMRTVSGNYISGPHADTGNFIILGQPLAGGWGATSERDGDHGQFSCGNGDTFNIPIELTEARFGVKVHRYAFHNEDGGMGRHLGGKGMVLEYEVRGPELFVTYMATRTERRPWAVDGGQEGSTNYMEIVSPSGVSRRLEMCTNERVVRGEIIRLVTATGGGNGDPKLRPAEQVARDIRNGFVTPEQAQRHFGVGA